jgi:hypothetical protein
LLRAARGRAVEQPYAISRSNVRGSGRSSEQAVECLSKRSEQRAHHSDEGEQYFVKISFRASLVRSISPRSVIEFLLAFSTLGSTSKVCSTIVLSPSKRYLAVAPINDKGIWFYFLHITDPRIARCLHRYDAVIFVKDR